MDNLSFRKKGRQSGEEKENITKNIVCNFPNVTKDKQIQEAQEPQKSNFEMKKT